MSITTTPTDMAKMEEFRSNLLLLLQCGYPEGLPMIQLKSEYKQYFMEDVAPELILPRGFKNNRHWDTLFQMKEFREDFTLFYMGTAVYIKAIRKRNFVEMKLIAQLAKHSHQALVKKAEFRCGCCSPDLWKTVAKESAQGPLAVDVSQQNSHSSAPPHHHPSPAEDIIVKIEPSHMLTNGGEDDDNSGSRGNHHHHVTSTDGSIYSIVQQAAHGNHHPANSYVNGGGVHDNSASGASNTNDGFMLDHQLRVQEQSSPQGQSLQAFASLLNSAGTGGTVPTPDAAGGTQPFYTFVIQNGEIKVMQIVSSSQDGATANGESSVLASPPTTQSSPVSVVKKSHSQKKSVPPPPEPVKASNDSHVCSMPGCGETFEIKQHLQNHERTCSLKKYPCQFPGCDRRFKNSKQRHAHMTSRHKGTENAFHCTVPLCTAVFKTNDRLKVHESRCRFKYEQFQLMDLDMEASVNNNNPSFQPSNHTSVPISNSSPDSVVSHPESDAAFSIQAASIASINAERVTQVPANGAAIKLENGNSTNSAVQHPNSEFQGFSTVDLSLVKSEVME